MDCFTPLGGQLRDSNTTSIAEKTVRSTPSVSTLPLLRADGSEDKRYYLQLDGLRGLAVSAPMFRAAMGGRANILLPGCLDALAGGAILALYSSTSGLNSIRRTAMWMAALGGSVWIVLYSLDHAATLPVAQAARTGCFCGVVGVVADGVGGVAGRFLSSRPMQFVGRISYGIYLYHLIVAGVGFNVFARIIPGLSIDSPRLIVVAVYALCTITFSIVSWRIVETFFNGLNTRFTLHRANQAAVIDGRIPVGGRTRSFLRFSKNV